MRRLHATRANRVEAGTAPMGATVWDPRGEGQATLAKTYSIFTDGACRGNPGPGGWGVLVRNGKDERRMCAVSYTHLTLPTKRIV